MDTEKTANKWKGEKELRQIRHNRTNKRTKKSIEVEKIFS